MHVQKDMGKTEFSHITVGLQIVATPLEGNMDILQGINPPFTPVKPPFNIYPKDIKLSILQ